LKLYIATSFRNREQARIMRDLLQGFGHVITSRWIDTHLEEIDVLTPARQGQEALEDLEDVAAADGVVFVNNTDIPSTSGGMHVEMGYALALGKPVYIVGPRTSVFHYHPLVVGGRTLVVGAADCGDFEYEIDFTTDNDPGDESDVASR
jgi:nucleoside 2-deoxyribosyltransferase